MGATESNRTKGSRRKNGLGKYSDSWEGFIEIPLNDTARAQLADWVASDEFDLDELLRAAGEAGYKLSVGPQNRGSSFVATLTGRTPDCNNCGFSLSAFGPGVIEALGAVFYKHFVLCQGGRWSEQQDAASKQLSMWG